MSKLLHTLQELESITIIDRVQSWKEAIKLCFNPLIKKDIVNNEYVEATITSGENLDFYYIIAEGLAMPHARPEDGVNKMGISMLVVREGVEFGNHIYNPVYCIIGLAATDNRSHIDTIMEISTLFDNEQTISSISQLQSIPEIIHFLSEQTH